MNALMVAGKLSEAEANQFLRDNPEVVEVLALVNEDAQLAAEVGFDTAPALANQTNSADEGSDNSQATPEGASTEESTASASRPNDGDYPIYEVVVTAEQLSVVENVGVTLGKGQRVMDDLAEENPTAALLVGVAIAGALGGPVKGAVAVLADQAVQAAAGEEIEAFEEALTNEMGTAITRPDESTDEFSANVADDPDGSDALIQDGSRFVLGTVIGIVSGKKFAGSKKGEGAGSDESTAHRGTEPGGADAEMGNPNPNHKIKRESGEPEPTVTPQLRQQYENDVRALANKADEMRHAGKSDYEIAETLNKERNRLKYDYRAVSDPDYVRRAKAKNLKDYGDELGPSVDWYRNNPNLNKRKTLQEIIESAARPGDGDI